MEGFFAQTFAQTIGRLFTPATVRAVQTLCAVTFEVRAIAATVSSCKNIYRA